MRIGELAKLSGVSARALRYYEEQEVLTSTRSSSGQRQYTEAHVERVRYLRQLYSAGLTSRTIAQLLPCTEAPSDKTSDAAFELLLSEKERLDNHIAELIRTRDMLDQFIANNRDFRASMTPGS